MNFCVRRVAEGHPDRPCLITDGRSLSFVEVARRVNAVEHWLLSVGVRPGQPTPFALDATLELRTVLVLFALFELGVPALLLHPRWTELERARVLRQAALAPQPLPDNFALFRSDSAPLELPEPAPEQPLAIVYTSGSSGGPRGVCLSRAAFLASAKACEAALGLNQEDRWLLCLPLAHIGGLSLLTRCLVTRLSVVMPSFTAVSDQFHAPDTLRLMENTAATVLSLVPTQLGRLLESSLRCPPKVRRVLLGGAAAPRSLLRRAAHARWPVSCSYGLTEACSLVTVEEQTAKTDGSSGRAVPGSLVRVVDGHIEVSSPSLLSSYFPQTELEPTAPVQDGWFRTSDCGALDEAGNLFVYGRADDVIISGGENVHPLEVENTLLEHPKIEAACVFAGADPTWGQVVCAALIVQGDIELQELPGWMALRLARFKCPKRVAFVQQLPTTASGKVSRLRARQLFEAQCVAWDELLK